MPEPQEGEENIFYDFVHYSPQKMVKQAIKRDDYRLISFAGGYQATAEDASVVGLECTGNVDTNPVVTGCIPPPSGILKRMVHYNLIMIEQSDFPHKKSCEVSPEVLKAFNME